MNLSAENIGKIRELVRSGYPLKARDAKDLLGHNDHLVELLEARGRLMLGVEIERDELRAEVAGLRTGYQAYEQVNAELKAEVEKLRGVMACVVSEVPRHEDRNGNAPGHCHSVPGVWDQSNGAKSGTECGWCKVWNAAAAMSKGEQP